MIIATFLTHTYFSLSIPLNGFEHIYEERNTSAIQIQLDFHIYEQNTEKLCFDAFLYY